MKVSSVDEMRAMDKAAMDTYGIAESLLMENAGLAAYSVLHNEFGVTGKTFLVFCGIGNNGGDGFVVARKIHSNGGLAKVFILGDPGKYTGSAKMNLDITATMPIEIRTIDSAASVSSDIAHCDGIVDAIFGTGLAREVGGLYAEIIEAINASTKTVLSLDIPSGIHGDTGSIMGTAIQADYTVSFGLPKRGNLLMPGCDLGGKLYVTHISFPPALYTAEDLKVEINITPVLPGRYSDGHKGDFGETLFIAGAAGYYGAPYFAALSFLKAGGGYSRLASPEGITPFIANKGSEIVFLPQKQTPSGSISYENRDDLLEISDKMDMIVMGPGLSLNEETAELVRELAAKIEKPVLIDGDGITAVCKDLDIIRKRTAPTILTPHLGEMSRITGIPVHDIDEDKIRILQAAARELGAIIVLKGAHSLIGYPDGKVFINLSGNSGMATAGSGDVLTGTIAAMFGLGLDIFDAVRKGVYLHGVSGDLASVEIGEDGMTAQDILKYLPRAVMMDREGLLDDLYEGVTVI
ncbi:MAG TPA: NAD(P)H-hydrate dehydratase [Deltaproteobacteria bacterium]|nr:NAD(P)H-hydrate dehydratase [Deltaproteobacteria bacterium]